MIFERYRDDPLAGILYLLGLVVALVVHELGHAWAAVWQGDDTPREQGRLSPNPLKHLDPIGAVLFLFTGFGWAKPVMTRPDLYRQPLLGTVVVAVAGIVLNLLMALAAGLFLRWLISSGAQPPGWAVGALASFVALNVVLAVFNALPIPPLDGSHLLAALVPGELGRQLRENLARSWWLLLVVLVLGREQVSALLGAAQRIAFGLIAGG